MLLFFNCRFKQSNNNSLDESNKGHQMLLKMGWAGAGTGLGVAGQGIDKPIDGGVVRDRQDVYKVRSVILFFDNNFLNSIGCFVFARASG